MFYNKLMRCDEIEGYNPSGKGLYNRKVVLVEIIESCNRGNKKEGQFEIGEKVPAFIYYKNDSYPIKEYCLVFKNGDWLEK